MSRRVASNLVIATILTTTLLAASFVLPAGAATKKAPAPPVITAQPLSTVVKITKVAHFRVKATGDPKPAYQWQISTNGGAFADLGAASSTLEVTASTDNDGSIYRAIISNPSGTVTSQTATLGIKPSPKRSKAKPLIVGLIDKGSETPYHQGLPYPPVDLTDVAAQSAAFAGVVVNQTWSQLEPGPGQFDFSTLDASLAAVAAYNAQHPEAQIGVRLRVFAAYAAPAWAKTLDGPPITVPANLPANTGGTLGQWWKPGYRSAWAGLQQALASRYDSNPVLREVAVSSCSTLTAEPFVMAPGTILLATADGWSASAQQACLDGAFSDYAPWTRTAIYYPVNPLAGDQTITDEVMQRCATSGAAGGPTCVLANNALNPVSATTGRSAPTYAEMNLLWVANRSTTPIAFQMDGPDNATYCAAIGVAVSYHAQSVELWPAVPGQPGFTAVPTATLVAWSNALRTGVLPTC
jgi:hypothetical protein